MRFERGIRPELTVLALKRATQLLTQLAGGEAASGLVDADPGKLDHEPILLSVDETSRVLGVEFSLDQVVDALGSLGFDYNTAGSKSEVWVTTPYWRSDIHQAVDLIEEVARIICYDKIPSTMLSQPLPKQNPEPIISLKQKVRNNLVGYGFQEVSTFSSRPGCVRCSRASKSLCRASAKASRSSKLHFNSRMFLSSKLPFSVTP